MDVKAFSLKRSGHEAGVKVFFSLAAWSSPFEEVACKEEPL